MFDHREIAGKALLRAEILKAKRAAKKRKATAAASSVFCLMLLTGLAFFLPALPAGPALEIPGVASGTLLAGAGVGGYVLMGIAGFVLGVVVTFFCTKKTKRD